MKLISTQVHTIIGVVVGLVLLVAPNLFGFNDNAVAALLPRIVGIFIILNELITTSPVSPLKLVPMKVHIVLDCVTGVFLALSPWLFGFADEAANVWVPHVLVGLLVVGYALVTNTADESRSAV